MLEPLQGNVEEEPIEGMALQLDGKIVTVGGRFSEPGGSSGVVSRYIADLETPPSPAVDLPPHSKIVGVPHRARPRALTRFHGTASDPDGPVGEVQVALVRLLPARKGKPSAAAKPKKWRTAKGAAKWSLKLKRPLAPGRYVVFSRAIDDRGLAEAKFSRGAGNRRAFRILAAG